MLGQNPIPELTSFSFEIVARLSFYRPITTRLPCGQEWTNRQADDAAWSGKRNPYTPQIVVVNRTGFGQP
jgi:hypothetical protein